jgi:lipid-A-disaccharide synthase
LIGLAVLLTALRELLRAAAFPLWMVEHLFAHRAACARVRAALAAPPAAAGSSALERFLERWPPRHRQGAHVFVSAGELSGEAHGARLIEAARALGVSARWTCFGGPRLAQSGAELRFALSEHAIMGLAGVLRSLPFLVRALVTYLRLLRDERPDLVVLVDYPGLHLVMARHARKRGIPVIHYVAPQYWAWAPWRLRRYRACVDATWTILPFEPAFYANAGILSEYVGHPLLDREAPAATAREPSLLCLLPGSRRSEIEGNVPALVAIARRLRRDHPELRCVLPHADERRAPLLRALLAREQASGEFELRSGPLGPTLAAAHVVLAKSGTGSLEATLHGAPTVVFYRMRGRIGPLLRRRYLTVPFIAAANLIAGRAVVPEFCFANDAGWHDVEAAARALLAAGPPRDAALAGIAEVRARLGEPGASRRAARWLQRYLAPAEARA